MPTVTATVVDALASCKDARCPGYKQEQVKAVETLTAWTFVEFGGDIPGNDRSITMLRFEDETDQPCPHCGEPRLVSDQVRPIYPNISGQPQSALLDIGRDSERVRDLELALAKSNAETAQLRATVAEQTVRSERQSEQIDQLLAALSTQTPTTRAKKTE